MIIVPPGSTVPFCGDVAVRPSGEATSASPPSGSAKPPACARSATGNDCVDRGPFCTVDAGCKDVKGTLEDPSSGDCSGGLRMPRGGRAVAHPRFPDARKLYPDRFLDVYGAGSAHGPAAGSSRSLPRLSDGCCPAGRDPDDRAI